MRFSFTDSTIYRNGRVEKAEFTSCEIPSVGDGVACISDNLFIFPGFADVHVHLREPGFSYKETVRTGTLAAAGGGYTDVCSMPNLSPVPDSAENLARQIEKIEQQAVVRVHPYGAITCGQKGQQLADLDAMAGSVCAFSDDGKGVQSEEMMRAAMIRCAELGKILAAHCEDEALVAGGCIHKGSYSEKHGLPGICSESEWKPIERDLRLAAETGCAYHVCHVSCAQSVELIRKAKQEGVNVTCETAPHYLVLCDEDLENEGRFKMNPPLRSASDREALIEGLLDGTIDIIATDHAPHSAEEKARGLKDSLMGIVGLETAFPVLYTNLVKTGRVPLEVIIRALTDNPRTRFGLEQKFDENFTVWDLSESYEIDPESFLTMGRSTPFAGMKVFGRCLLTVCSGKVVYKGNNFNI